MTKTIQPNLFTETTIIWRNYRALYVDNRCCVRAIWNRLLFFLFSRCNWFLGKAVDQNHKITWKAEANALSGIAKTRCAFLARLEKATNEHSPDFKALEAAGVNYIKAVEKRVDQLVRFALPPEVRRLDIKGFQSEILDQFHQFCALNATVNQPALYAGLQPTIEKLDQTTAALFEKLKKVYPVSILKNGPSTQPKKTVRFADEAPENPLSLDPVPLSPDQRESMALYFGEMLNDKKKPVAIIGEKIIDTFRRTGRFEAVQEDAHRLFAAIQDLVTASEKPLVQQAAPSLRVNDLDTRYQALSAVIDAIQDTPTSTCTHAALLNLWLQLAKSLQLNHASIFLQRFPDHVAKSHNDSPEHFQWAGGFQALKNYAHLMSEAYLSVYPTAEAQDVEAYAKRQVAYFLSIVVEGFTQWEAVVKDTPNGRSHEFAKVLKDPFKTYAKSAAVVAHLKTNPPLNDPIWQTVEIGKHIHHFAKPDSEQAQVFLTHVLSAPPPLN